MKTFLTIFTSVLLSSVISYGIVHTSQQKYGATVITTQTSDTLETFRQNVNSSLVSLNGTLAATTTANTWTGAQTFNNAPIFSTLSGLLQGNAASAITGITGTIGQFPYYNGTNTLLATSTINLSTASFLGIGSTSPSSLLTVGPLIANGSTTISTGKLQFDLYSTGGVRACAFLLPSGVFATSTGACNP